jgi:hypothetical protein
MRPLGLAELYWFFVFRVWLWHGLDAINDTYILVINSPCSLIQTIKAGKMEDGNQSINLNKFGPVIYFVVLQIEVIFLRRK